MGATCPSSCSQCQFLLGDSRENEVHTLTPCRSFQILKAVAGGWWLTCSLTNFVVPASSTHSPRKSSPRKGFSGFSFFRLPLSSLVACWCFRVLRNHWRTKSARFSEFCSFAGATKRLGCSAQYVLNSTMDCGARRNGGAVMDVRSPLNVAIDFKCCVSYPIASSQDLETKLLLWHTLMN